jgi:hypothetical protein
MTLLLAVATRYPRPLHRPFHEYAQPFVRNSSTLRYNSRNPFNNHRRTNNHIRSPTAGRITTPNPDACHTPMDTWKDIQKVFEIFTTLEMHHLSSIILPGRTLLNSLRYDRSGNLEAMTKPLEAGIATARPFCPFREYHPD